MLKFEWILVFLLAGLLIYALLRGSKKTRSGRENFAAKNNDRQPIQIYNAYHLGDNVFSMIYFNKIKQYIEEKHITIEYYCKPEHHKQLREFVPSSNIILKDYHDGMDTSKMHDAWIGHHEYKCNNYTREKCDDKTATNGFDDFLKAFFNEFSQKIEVEDKMDKFAYSDDDLLKRYDKLPNAYKDCDILVVNADPLSGQMVKDDGVWTKKIEEFAKHGWKVVITKKTTDKAKCTLDDKLTIKDIAAISTHTKVIIAVNTGVVPGFFNSYTLDNIRKAYIFDSNNYYSYPKFEKRTDISDITVEELTKIL